MSTKWERRFGWIMVFFPLFVWTSGLLVATFDAAVTPIGQRARTLVAVTIAILASSALIVFGGQTLTRTAARLSIMNPPRQATSS